MRYTPVLATLGYVLSADGRSVLMIRRTRPDDVSYGKYNGLGGKVDAAEDVAASLVREIEEEAGIRVTKMELRGTLNWPGFGRDNESWFAFVFRVTAWEGEPHATNREGDLEWIAIDDLLARRVPLWEGDYLWLPMVFDNDPRPFHGVEPYDGTTPLLDRWSFTRL